MIWCKPESGLRITNIGGIPVPKPWILRANFILVVSFTCAGISNPAQAQRPRDEALNADQGWVDTTRADLDYQFDLFTAAYNLDAQQQAALRQELEVRLYQEKAFEDKEWVELNEIVQKMTAAGAGDDDNAPETKAAFAKLNHFATNMPTGPDQIADWVDKQVGPRATEGRARWEELRNRGDATRDDKDEMLAKAAAERSTLAESRNSLEAKSVPVTGQPIPSGENATRVWPKTEKQIDQSRVIPPNFAEHPELIRPLVSPPPDKLDPWKPAPLKPGQINPDENVQLAQVATPAANTQVSPQAAVENASIPQMAQPAPLKAAPQAPAPPPPQLPAAPPLDDWDKYVISTATKYQFDDAQLTKAQSILRELKRRANQYRLSRADELARAQLMTDARERDGLLKSLNRPLDALFDELKQRLESLPTVEQRQKAGATTPSGKKR